MTEEWSIACQVNRCGECPYNDDEFADLEPDWCLHDCHVEDPGDEYDGPWTSHGSDGTYAANH